MGCLAPANACGQDGGRASSPLTFPCVVSSIPQEPGMGTMGLALPWKTRITSALHEPAAIGRWETRVGPSEHLTGGPAQAGAKPANEDAALAAACRAGDLRGVFIDRKSTRLNSSHVAISYAVFCLKKKN